MARYDIDVDVNIDVAGAMQRLTGMELRSKNFKPVYEDARDYLEKANAANFTAGGLPSGGWQPREQVYGWPIMKRTGKLFSSLTNLRGAPNTITATGAQIFGTNVEYAKFHQYGTEKMPKRQIIFNPSGFSELMGQKAARWVSRGVTA
jgi:phage gpG-like protein